ncbi:uncharacterized protein A4U43_C03F18780 [Asparagus officinalis]|uniref:Late embryogenesis abundant protein LEA-2 subgroup domain-containing protein n=1 Tax=Asparagus officinalis TaxID=4686 RepID=A0A5P1FB75_ASPOF|nr:uncharacterized protein LOC109832261 [Asparagus officinalis]ONK75618.1 uncharacterized protein A4U43_C03F18780 [Asparagus officinalis]
MLIVYAMIINAFVHLYYKPKYPTVSLTSVTVSSFTTSSKSSTISSDITLTVTLKNPNEDMDITYGGIDSHVLYHDDFIATNDYRSFVHNAGETISKVIRLVEEDGNVDAHTINAIDGDVANNHGVVKFEVKMEALLAFSKIHWIPELLAVSCPDVNIQFENGTTKGTMVGPAVTCSAF